MSHLKNFTKGFFKENAVFVLFLGLCPTLGVTSSAFNGLGMGVATMFVLLMSNIVVSLVKTQIRLVLFLHLNIVFQTDNQIETNLQLGHNHRHIRLWFQGLLIHLHRILLRIPYPFLDHHFANAIHKGC